MKNHKGQVVTFLTLGLVVVGTLITLGTSLFVNNKKTNLASNSMAAVTCTGNRNYFCYGTKCLEGEAKSFGSYCGNGEVAQSKCKGGSGCGGTAPAVQQPVETAKPCSGSCVTSSQCKSGSGIAIPAGGWSNCGAGSTCCAASGVITAPVAQSCSGSCVTSSQCKSGSGIAIPAGGWSNCGAGSTCCAASGVITAPVAPAAGATYSCCKVYATSSTCGGRKMIKNVGNAYQSTCSANGYDNCSDVGGPSANGDTKCIETGSEAPVGESCTGSCVTSSQCKAGSGLAIPAGGWSNCGAGNTCCSASGVTGTSASNSCTGSCVASTQCKAGYGIAIPAGGWSNCGAGSTCCAASGVITGNNGVPYPQNSSRTPGMACCFRQGTRVRVYAHAQARENGGMDTPCNKASYGNAYNADDWFECPDSTAEETTQTNYEQSAANACTGSCVTSTQCKAGYGLAIPVEGWSNCGAGSTCCSESGVVAAPVAKPCSGSCVSSSQCTFGSALAIPAGGWSNCGTGNTCCATSGVIAPAVQAPVAQACTGSCVLSTQCRLGSGFAVPGGGWSNCSGENTCCAVNGVVATAVAPETCTTSTGTWSPETKCFVFVLSCTNQANQVFFANCQ